MGESVLIGVYAVWFMLIVLRQRPLRLLLSRWDVFSLLPGWRLFEGPAAGPDLSLLVRVVHRDGRLSGWEQVPIWLPKPRTAWVWHPQLTQRTIIASALRQMGRASGRTSRSRVRRSFSYGAFLRFFSGRARDRGAVGLQFVVYGFCAHDLPHRREVMFLSDVHGLDGEPLPQCGDRA